MTEITTYTLLRNIFVPHVAGRRFQKLVDIVDCSEFHSAEAPGRVPHSFARNCGWSIFALGLLEAPVIVSHNTIDKALSAEIGRKLPESDLHRHRPIEAILRVSFLFGTSGFSPIQYCFLGRCFLRCPYGKYVPRRTESELCN